MMRSGARPAVEVADSMERAASSSTVCSCTARWQWVLFNTSCYILFLRMKKMFWFGQG
uniref:Uncharacterized protein n=1 Tax=Arundo donax TaxID=35708 RepID=A0A0A9AJQ8_ARUDO